MAPSSMGPATSTSRGLARSGTHHPTRTDSLPRPSTTRGSASPSGSRSYLLPQRGRIRIGAGTGAAAGVAVTTIPATGAATTAIDVAPPPPRTCTGLARRRRHDHQRVYCQDQQLAYRVGRQQQVRRHQRQRLSQRRKRQEARDRRASGERVHRGTVDLPSRVASPTTAAPGTSSPWLRGSR